MAKTVLGKVTMNPAGIWNAATAYKRLDVVESPEGSFMAKQDNQGIPVSDASMWQKLADRGPAGEGNVTVTEDGLTANQLYLFKPSQNNKAMGSFSQFTPAEQQQADWNESDTASKAYIKNKPAAPNTVSPSADGLMSKADKTKLDGIEAEANKYVHPNDANNRHVTDAEKSVWNSKAEGDHNHDVVYQAKQAGKGLSSNDYTTADKKKLAGIEAQAQKNIPPKHKTATLTVANWTNGEPYTYTITDADIVDGCYVQVIVGNDSVETASDAELLPAPSFSVGKMIIYAKKRPTNTINILYTILL